ncbi:hypothetical protein ACLQ2R_26770 [Streptosporangium sp. DT93]|uniref:hypothetical protein n=1 Tax=Streptosporangium sp. DT93 TaxID=3393428 RepID=UPI003CE702E2
MGDRREIGDSVTEIIPTDVIRPGTISPGTVSGTGAVALPAPMVSTVGDIPGLRPRRARGDGGDGDGGEVRAADVDAVDALKTATWSTVAAWVRAGKAVTTRRARPADVDAFLRRLTVELPGVGLLQVSEGHLTHYRDGAGTARTGLSRSGVALALAPAAVSRRPSSLPSLYGYATRRRVLALKRARRHGAMRDRVDPGRAAVRGPAGDPVSRPPPQVPPPPSPATVTGR